MKCEHVLDFWEADPACREPAEPDAADDRRHEAEEHLRECADCRRAVKMLRAADESLASLYAPVSAPDGFAADVLREWSPAPRRERAGFPVWRVAAAMLVVAAAGVAAGFRLAPVKEVTKIVQRPGAAGPARAETPDSVQEILLVTMREAEMEELLRYFSEVEVVLRKVKNRPASPRVLASIRAEVEAEGLVERGRILSDRLGGREPRLAEILDGSQILLLRLSHAEEETYPQTHRTLVRDMERQDLLERMAAVKRIMPPNLIGGGRETL